MVISGVVYLCQLTLIFIKPADSSTKLTSSSSSSAQLAVVLYRLCGLVLLIFFAHPEGKWPRREVVTQSVAVDFSRQPWANRGLN